MTCQHGCESEPAKIQDMQSVAYERLYLQTYVCNKTANRNGKSGQFTTMCVGDRTNITLVGHNTERYKRNHVEDVRVRSTTIPKMAVSFVLQPH